LKDERRRYSLWSLASALPALLSRGLTPELVITTDPGFWNGEHARWAIQGGLPVAMPPSAYIPASVYTHCPVIPLDSGLPFEKAALSTYGSHGIPASASGSAAGTALSLALRATSGPVFLAGYDLAAHGLIDHAFPYALNVVDEMLAARRRPVLTSRAHRVFDAYPGIIGHWRLSRAFSSYASSTKVTQSDAERVYRLGDSPVSTGVKHADTQYALVILRNSENRQSVAVRATTQTSVSHLSQDGLNAMLSSMVEQAVRDAHISLASKAPVPYDAALLFKALAPCESAPFLARAARKIADEDELANLTRILEQAAAALMEAS
ncbi:MAG: hypothetical protein JXM71_12320, partial [Spirochaetales bacterium]|nr:hypothetical protein [Spirochaetales bacterium]